MSGAPYEWRPVVSGLSAGLARRHGHRESATGVLEKASWLEHLVLRKAADDKMAIENPADRVRLPKLFKPAQFCLTLLPAEPDVPRQKHRGGVLVVHLASQHLELVLPHLGHF